MEIIGRLKKILPSKSGTTERGEWVSTSFLLEVGEPGFLREVFCTAFKTERQEIIKNLGEGALIKISVNVSSVESTENPGYYKTSLIAWKIERAINNN